MDALDKELEQEIFLATKSAVERLFSEYSEHHFYYVVLVTTGEALRPYLSAWSHELLNERAESSEEAKEIKWSYADSPLCGYADDCFTNVERLFLSRPQIDESEYNIRILSMESALSRLDSTGVFGKGKSREKIYLNVEVVPPDQGNTERAKRLNPKVSLKHWLIDAAE